MCVDDGCLAGNELTQELTELALQKFESRPREWEYFDFFGTSISTVRSSHFKISQKDYIGKLKPLPLHASFERFRSYWPYWLGLGTRDQTHFVLSTKLHKLRLILSERKRSRSSTVLWYNRRTLKP